MLLFSTLLLAVLISAVLTSAMCYLARWVWVSGGNAGICCLSCNEKINILYSPADTCWTFCITIQYSHVLNSHVTAMAKEELCYINKNCWVDIFGLGWLCGGTVSILAGFSGKSEKLSFLPRVPLTGFGSLCAVWGLVIDRLLINAARPKRPCAVADKGMCSVCCLFGFTGVAHCLGQALAGEVGRAAALALSTTVWVSRVLRHSTLPGILESAWTVFGSKGQFHSTAWK